MATITVRKVDDVTKQRLRERAARRGRSMESEVRLILEAAVAADPAKNERNLADQIQELFAPCGGLNLPDTPRQPHREPPTFE